MTDRAMLPCIVCGTELPRVWDGDADSAPYGGTEFRTYGHYGSTFWDSFDGEELVLTVCDDCLRERASRLAQQKRFLPLRCSGMSAVGQQWVERPMVPYTGHPDTSFGTVEPEELGDDLPGVDWSPHIDAIRSELGRDL